MSEVVLLLLGLAAAPEEGPLGLYPKVVALAKAPSPSDVRRLMLEAVDQQALVDRILVDTTLDAPSRDRLAKALIENLERRATSSLGERAFTCDRDRAIDGRDDSGTRTLTLACTRGDQLGTIVLFVSPKGRVFDATLEGALLSRNLRAQINRGLRQHGLEEVIRKLGIAGRLADH